MRKLLFIIIFGISSLQAWVQTPLLVAPHFEAKDFRGVPHELYTYLNSGKYVLLDFFTTNCGTCAVYNPHINMAYTHFGCNTGGLIVLGINWGSTNTLLAQYHQANGFSFPALSGFEGYGNEITEIFQIPSFISVILIAPNRQIVQQYIYPPSFDVLKSIISSYGITQSPCAVGTDEQLAPEKDSIKVYPNPASSHINILGNFGTPYQFSATLYDVTGRLIRRFDQNFSLASGVSTLNIKGIAPGHYILKVIDKDGFGRANKLIIKPE